MFGGVELFKTEKSPRLVFSGETAPWELEAALEAEVLAGYTGARVVPDECSEPQL